MSDLTILCISEGRDHAKPFIEQLGGDADAIGAEFLLLRDGHELHSGGYVESVLDKALEQCETEYVFRLDDDERLPLQTVAWLASGAYRKATHWAFKRRNLWPDEKHFIFNPPLYPDLQTRLSVKEKSGRRSVIHSGSPFGTGEVAPFPIDHYKFLVRPKEEREALLQRYDNIAAGAGAGYIMFSLPEHYEGLLSCKPV